MVAKKLVMNKIDQIYLTILKIGLVSLREASAAGDSRRCEYEAEHLHNIPALVGDDNPERHLYYFNHERNRFVEAARAHARSTDNQSLLVNLSLYIPHWDELIKEIGD
jgi:hypothetical protein